MEHRYYQDRKNVSYGLGLILIFWILFCSIFLIDGRVIEFITFFSPALILSMLILLGLIFGFYLAIDLKNEMYIKSVFFIRSKPIKIVDIYKIDILDTVGTVLFTIPCIKYKNDRGKLKIAGCMAKEIFKKEEFEKFIEELCLINPKIEVDKKLLENQGENINNSGNKKQKKYGWFIIYIAIIILGSQFFGVIGAIGFGLITTGLYETVKNPKYSKFKKILLSAVYILGGFILIFMIDFLINIFLIDEVGAVTELTDYYAYGNQRQDVQAPPAGGATTPFAEQRKLRRYKMF